MQKKLTGPAFEPLKSEKFFNNIRLVDGVVTWLDETIDCAPEWMYSHSTTINGCNLYLDPEQIDLLRHYYCRGGIYDSNDKTNANGETK